jgi:hypothetical protein
MELIEQMGRKMGGWNGRKPMRGCGCGRGCVEAAAAAAATAATATAGAR